MTYRAIDFHAHARTGERRGSGPATADADKLFKTDLRTADPVSFYAERDLMAVVFDVDAESASGERIANDETVELVARSAGRLIGFASVDPWKGRAAVRELERCVEAGLRGLKLQPITQAFAMQDHRFDGLWDACQALGLPVLVHTGTTGIGAGAPGGRGLRLEFGRPVPGLDDVAARYPKLTLVAAHFAWPWHLELLAVARHKGNVYIDLSGWAPRYIPEEVLRYCNSVMPEKFLFGSDFPLLSPDRWLTEFSGLELKDGVREAVLWGNACRILGLDTADFADAPTGNADALV
ncbi:MAG TPA: amidohydrolase family protein [Candidatus Saccharimonadales bacterium]|nr:amidohydrolase family protein [Candidatus Saccharimonadales bacterium]